MLGGIKDRTCGGSCDVPQEWCGGAHTNLSDYKALAINWANKSRFLSTECIIRRNERELYIASARAFYNSFIQIPSPL